MFSKSLYFAAECAPVLSSNRAPDFRRGNRCNRARHFGRPCASARRPCGIPRSQCFWRLPRVAFDRSSSAAATLRARSSISQLERKSAGRNPLPKHQAPSTKHQRSTRSQAPSPNGSHERALEFGAWSFAGAWMLVLGSSSIRQRECRDCAVEKIIDVAGGRSRVTMDRNGACPVNVLVTPAGDQETGPSGDNDVFCKQRPPLESGAAIEREIVAGVVREQHKFGCGCVDGPNVIHVHEASQFRCAIRVQAVADDDDAWINGV